MSALLNPEERVLATLNADGSRRWIDPTDVAGAFRRLRKALGWVLIAVFITLPHLHVGDEQLFFVNIARGEFTLFGATFLRTDTLLLALALISVFVAIFLVTALFGRVWCGWACPQTVYLEFVFRPIATLFDGKGRRGLRGAIAALPKNIRVPARWLLVTAICFFLANTFLAYFVGSRTVLSWSTQMPWIHPVGFGFVVLVTALMVGNFGFFREQLCLIACPYGRLQSVMLDKHSLIVGYDARRGEPRGKRRARPGTDARVADLPLPVIAGAAAFASGPAERSGSTGGDCVDCNRCVSVCPTGIDIRDGLQLECIHCARCIDACDTVMTKLGRPAGLIRYSSQSVLAGERGRFLRPRVIAYPAILAIVLGSLIALSAGHAAADVRVLRDKGQPFYTLPTGEISNQIRVRITNRSDEPRTYAFAVDEPGYRLELPQAETTVAPGETASVRVLMIARPESLRGALGVARVPIRIHDASGFATTRTCKFLAPMNVGGAAPAENTP